MINTSQIIKAVEEFGVTRLALQTGVNRTTIYRIITGRSSGNGKTLDRLFAGCEKLAKAKDSSAKRAA